MKELPPGWAWTTLGEAAEISPRLDRSEIDPATPVSFVPMAAVEAGTGVLNPSATRTWASVSKGYVPFAEGDILFARITPCMENGKVAIARRLTNGIGAGSTEFHVIRARESIEPLFLLHYLLQERIRQDARTVMHGAAGQLRVPARFLQTLTMPLPPSAEQRRIVAEIEKQFARLDSAAQTLERVRGNLNRCRASTLKAASEGRLVPTERELARGQDHPDQSAERLLQAVLANRRARWEQHEIHSIRRDGGVSKVGKWRSKYKEPAGPAAPPPFPLPEGWAWVTIGQLAWSVRDGPHFSPEYAEEGIPFISGGNVRPNGVDFDSAKRIAPELHRQFSLRTKPEKGDLLYTKGGTTGIARANTYDIEFSVWVHVAVLKLASGVDPSYLQHTLNSPACYAQAQRFTHGVGNQDLGLTRMVNIMLGLPPLPEQMRIAAEVDRRQSIADQSETLIETSLLHASRLRGAVLKSAFEGKLVTQDPNDEPASVLLERIRAARAQMPARRAPRKREVHA